LFAGAVAACTFVISNDTVFNPVLTDVIIYLCFPATQIDTDMVRPE